MAQAKKVCKLLAIQRSIMIKAWATMRENLTFKHANNKITDQPAYPHSLISSQSCSMQNFNILISTVSEQAGTLSEIPKTGYPASRPKWNQRTCLSCKGRMTKQLRNSNLRTKLNIILCLITVYFLKQFHIEFIMSKTAIAWPIIGTC